MSEAAFVGTSDNVAVSPASTVTYYGNFGFSAAATVTAETAEANARLTHRGNNATLKTLRVNVPTNSRNGTSSVTTEKNGSDTSQVASIAALTTGIFTDLGNTVSLTDGDTFSYKLAIGSTTGSFLLASITANLENSGQASNYWCAVGSVSTAVASATRYWPVAGQINTAATTESLCQTPSPVAGVASNFRVRASAARATATTAKFRVNGVDGTQSVSITGTGDFEDTSHTDNLAAGDLVSAATVTGSGSDTLTITAVSFRYTGSASRVVAVASVPNLSTSLTAGATRYYNPIGKLTTQATESTNQSPAPYNGIAERLSVFVSANASTTTASLTLRKGGVDTSLVVAIPGGATGGIADTTHSVAFLAGDLLSIKGSGADGTVTFRSMSMRVTEVVVFIASGVRVANPGIGSPAISQVHAVTASNLRVATPALGAPTLGQAQVLSATGLTVATPTLGSPAITVYVDLAATGLRTASPTLGAPSAQELNVLNAAGIRTALPTMGSPSLGQVHALTGTGVRTAAPSLGTPALAVTDAALLATGLRVAAPTIGSAALHQAHALSAFTLRDTAPAFGTPAIAQVHALAALELRTAAPSFGEPTLQLIYGLSASGLRTGTPSLGTPTLVRIVDFDADDLQVAAPFLGEPVLSVTAPNPRRAVMVLG